MTTTTRRTLAVLAAVAIVLIAGGLLFDHNETQSYSECMNGFWGTFSAGDLTVPEPDPDVYTGNLYLPDCQDANRAGLIAAGIGAAALAASAIIWWRQRSAPTCTSGE